MNEFLAFARRGKNAAWRYVAVWFLGILTGGLILVAGSTVLALAHLIGPQTPSELQHPTDAAVFFVGVAASFGAILAGFVFWAWVIQRKRPFDILGEWHWRLFFAGVAVWLAVEIVGTAIDLVLAPKGFSITASHKSASLALYAAMGLGVQTFAEEYVFRGYLTQGLLLAFKRPLPAAIVSGLLFGALHIPNGIPQAVNAVFFGTVCAWIAIRTGGIAFTYGLHLVNNYLGAVVIVSTDDVFKGSPGLFSQNTPGLVWSDIVFAAVALGLVLILVERATPHPPHRGGAPQKR